MKNKKKWLLTASVLTVVILGTFIFSGCINDDSIQPEVVKIDHPKKQQTPVEQASNKTLWTCPMHPQIQADSASDGCPICGMNLVPLKNENVTTAQGAGCGNV